MGLEISFQNLFKIFYLFKQIFKKTGEALMWNWKNLLDSLQTGPPGGAPMWDWKGRH